MDTTHLRGLAACLQTQAMKAMGILDTATWEDLNRMDDALNNASDANLEEWLDALDWEWLRKEIAATEREVFPEGPPPYWEE